ncbi:DIP1984 family protein [Aquibacillus koreensis]|uniref:DIP1984 family protein n=1 Tax=Aquibacillus koreensis TaxID=279446 RepID=A0A9X3WPD6_9BACI|nr:DIP1984 family protein [Aquibacillus koreensis]MCT2535463.1 DIP1984 family protein [Aquibacillus koreensis]MDC3422298.1 DIP1984 family protein [Aquibacillus koreensis]
MANITLAEAVKLKSILSKRIHELEEEMFRVAFVQMESGSELPKQNRTLSNVEKEIELVRADFRLLDKLMYQANIENEVVFNGESISIVEAIELATQLRAKARKLKELASCEKEEHLYFGETTTMVKVALYDPEEYRQRSVETERLANRLSNLINAKNYAIELAFDSEKYF